VLSVEYGVVVADIQPSQLASNKTEYKMFHKMLFTVMLAIGIGLLTKPKLSEHVKHFFEQLDR
jgi:hypothetical protein